MMFDTCAEAVRPVPATSTVFDPSPAKYAGPATLEGETPASRPAEPGVVERDGGLEYTFIDKGAAEGALCAGSSTRYYFTQTRIASSALPRCWKYVTEPVSDCADPAPEDPDTLAPAPPVDPDFNEFDPVGPQPGPPGAPTVDKPDL